MGLFSRLVLAAPMFCAPSSHEFQNRPQRFHFPDSGARTSLRLMPTIGLQHKRRRTLRDKSTIDEELSCKDNEIQIYDLDFMGEVLESVNTNHFRH